MARSRDTAIRGDAWETKSREAYLISGVSWYWAREGKKGRETGTDSDDKRERIKVKDAGSLEGRERKITTGIGNRGRNG